MTSAATAVAPDYDESEDRSWTPLQQKNDEELEFFTDLAIQETQRWIECVTKKAFKYPDDPLRSLSDGVLLCELLNCLKPGCIKRVNRLSTTMAKLDNITLFLEACKSAFGLRVEQLFSANDLQLASEDDGPEGPGAATAVRLEEDRRLRSVAITVFWLARQIRGSYHGPDIDFSAFAALVAARPDVLPMNTHDLSAGSSPAELDAAIISRSEGSDNEPDLPRSSDCSWDGTDGRLSAQQQASQHRSVTTNPLQFVALKPATNLARTAEALLRKTELAKSTARADGSGGQEIQRSAADDWQGNLSSWKERRRSKSLSQAQSSMDDSSIHSDGDRRVSKRSSTYMRYPMDDDGNNGLNGDYSSSNEQSTCGAEHDGSRANNDVTLGNGDREHNFGSAEQKLEADADGRADAGQCHVECIAPGKYKISFESFAPAYDGFGLTLRGGRDKLEPITVEFVSPGSPADVAGLEEGDEVLEIDNERADDKTRGYCMTIVNRASRSSGSLALIVQKGRPQWQHPQQQQHTNAVSIERDYATSAPMLAAVAPAAQRSIDECIDDDTGERIIRYRSREETPTTVPPPPGSQAAEEPRSQMPVASLRGAAPAEDRTDGPAKTYTSVTELRLSGGLSAPQLPASMAASWSFGGGSKFRGSHDDAEERRRMEDWAKQQEELSQAQFDRDQQLLRKKFEDDQRLAAEAEQRQQLKEGDSVAGSSSSASAGSGLGSKGVAPAKLELSNLHDREARERAARKLQELKQKYAPTDVSESPLQRRSSQLLATAPSSTNGDSGFSGGVRLSRGSSIDDRERELRKREEELRRMEESSSSEEEERLQQEQERIAREQQRLQQLKDGGTAAAERRSDGWPVGSGHDRTHGGDGSSFGSKATPSYADVYKCFDETEPPKELGSRDAEAGPRMTRREVVELNRKPAHAAMLSSAAKPQAGELTAGGRRNSFDDARTTGTSQRSSATGSGGGQEPPSPAVVTKDDVLRATREKARYASPPARPADAVPRDSASAAAHPMRKSVSGFDMRDEAAPRSLSPASADDSSEVVSKSMDFRSSRAMFEQQCKTAEAAWQQRQADENQRRLLARRKSVGSAAAVSNVRQQSPPVVPSAGKTVQNKPKFQTHLPIESLGSGATPEQLERQRELERLKAAREREASADEGAAREKERRLREERLRELAALHQLNQEYEREKLTAAAAPQPSVHARGRRRSLSGSSSDEEVRRIQQGGNRQKPFVPSVARLQGQDPSIAQMPPYESEQIPIMQSEQEVMRMQLERQKELEAMRRSREAHTDQDEALEEIRRIQQQKALQLQRLERLKEASASQQQPMVEVGSGAFASASPRPSNMSPSAPYTSYAPQHSTPSYSSKPAAGFGAPAPATGSHSQQQQQQWRPSEPPPRGSGAATAEQQRWQDESRRAASELESQRRLDDSWRAAELEQQQRRAEEVRRVAELEQQLRVEEGLRAAELEQHRRLQEARRLNELEQQRRADEARRAAELEQQRRVEEARRLNELEQQRRAEEARRAAELEQQRRAEEARRLNELEQQRRADEARRAAELEQQRRVEEARRLNELEQQRRAEEARRAAELEQQRRADEARRAAELEQQRRAEEARRLNELEQQRRADEARRAAELEQQRRVEEARRLNELEQQRRAEEARRAAEFEQQRQAEEARKMADLEQQQRRQEEGRRIAELEQQRRQEEARRAASVSDLALGRGGYRSGEGWAVPQQPEQQWRHQSSQELRQTPYGSSPELSLTSGAAPVGRGLPTTAIGQRPAGELPSSAVTERSGPAQPRAEQEYAYINRRGMAAGDRPLLQGSGSGLQYDHYYADGGHSDPVPRVASSGWPPMGQQQSPQAAFGLDGRESEVSHSAANTNYATYVPQQSASVSDLMRPAGDAASGRPPAAVWQQPGAMHRSQDDDMVSVSAKQHCAFCSKELGKGAAMVIETLSLYYHVDCFRCCVCHSRLSNGTTGADVRVRGNKLHCKNCYSNDEAGVKYSAV